MKFTLPLPPGINRTYAINRNAKNPMYVREEVLEWRELAGWDIKRIHKGTSYMFTGPVAIGIVWFYRYDRDVDAGIKSLLDLFEHQSIVKNDRQFREILYVRMYQDVKNPRCEIEIQPL